jgi:ABC-type multidrug transport system fused ATPase/permease subunit
MKALIAAFRCSVSLLPPGMIRRLWWLLPLMIMSAVLEMVGLALILPLVNAVANPGVSLRLPIVGTLPDLGPGGGLLIPLAALVAVFYLLKNAFLLLAAWIENRFVMDVVWRGASDLLGRYLRAPYVFHLRHNSAELIRNVNLACDDVFRGVLKPLLRLAAEGQIVGGVFLVLLLADPLVTVCMGLFLGALLGLFYVATHQRISQGGRRSQALHGQVLQELQQSLGSLKEIRVRRVESHFLATFRRLRGEMADIQVFNQTIVEVPRLSIETVLVFAFVLAVAVISWRGGMAADALPLLALYALAGFRLMPSFNKLVLYANTARFNIPAMNNVLAHTRGLDALAIDADAGTGDPLGLTDAICLTGVGYQYPEADGWALQGIDLTIAKGSSVGLVGPSGSGKTTLVDVILGLLPPTEGTLAIDGTAIAAVLPRWQRTIGYIPQFIYILDDSVRRNVAIGLDDVDIDDDLVWQALELARLDQVVRGLPDGLGTRLGERGVLLSGGQRQRIGIARALYHQPRVLVMDEATSALDSETEREVSDAIDRLAGDRTLIIIAHRLTTVRRCDVVHLMAQGRIIDSGGLDDLVGRHPELDGRGKDLPGAGK